MLKDVKQYLKHLNPSLIGVNTIHYDQCSKLGMGESNLNFRFETDKNSYILRINMTEDARNRTIHEYEALKIVESLHIAPKAYIYEPNSTSLSNPFLIIEFIEGKSLENHPITKNSIGKIAEITAKLHNIKISKEIRNISTKPINLEFMRVEIKQIQKYLQTKWQKYGIKQPISVEEVLQKTTKKPLFWQEQLVLGHGDIAPQNTILDEKQNLKLIDWESLNIMDCVLDITMVFDSFDLSHQQQEVFLRDYLDRKPNQLLREKFEFIWPIHLIRIFFWSLRHVFEIGDKELHLEFTKAQNLSEHVKYAKKMFQKCEKERIFGEKWEVENFFPKHYLKDS